MKKKLLLIVLGIFLSGSIFAQSCITDVWMSIKNDQIGKAKKLMDECMIGNESSADAWLMKGNVYLRRYQQEQIKLKSDPSYVIKDVDAIWIANEAFYKALELNNKVEPKLGMFSPTDGQLFCAEGLVTEGQKALKNNDPDRAFKFIETAATIYKTLDKGNANLPYNLGIFYLQLAQIAYDKKDIDTYKRMLQEGMKAKTSLPEVYLFLYDLYKSEKDTVNCGNVLKVAKSAVPDTLAFDLHCTELEYLAMTNQLDKFNSMADTLIKRNNDTLKLSTIAVILTNNNQFDKAETAINKGLAIFPNNFDLNQKMGYNYFFKAVSYNNAVQAATDARQYTKVAEIQAEQKAILEKAHTWCEKAYLLNSNDKDNNIMLKQLKVQLNKPVPEDLKAKCDSYQQK
jgi:tetratricopeptide (TPR) repeat protein